jgi:hypothetical protein
VLTAIALPYSALPLAIIKRYGLDRLAHQRGGEKELQFHLASAIRILPPQPADEGAGPVGACLAVRTPPAAFLGWLSP